MEEATVTAPEWIGEYEGFGADDVKVLSRYPTVDEALKGIANKDRMISSSIRFPDENTPEEERTKFEAKIHEYRGVPKDAKDYEIEHPELPEGMAHDAEFENQMRQVAIEEKVSKKAMSRLAKVFAEYRINQHLAYAKEAKATIDRFIEENGQERANQILGYTDKDGKQVTGTAKRGWMGLSKEMNFDYVDDHNEPQSKLIDSLEKINPGGVLGNDPILINIGQWLWETRYKEGDTPIGNAPEGGGEPSAFSDKFYATTDQGEPVD